MAWCRSTKQRRAMRVRRAVQRAMYFERGRWWLPGVDVIHQRLDRRRLDGQGWRGAVFCDALVFADDGSYATRENLTDLTACLREVYRPRP